MAHHTHHDAERVLPAVGQESLEAHELNPAPIAAGRDGAASDGGSAGEAAVTAVNPTAEDAYWRDVFVSLPYTDDTLGYDQYRPAYRYGWESRTRFTDRRWAEVERELAIGWRENRGPSRLGWGDAKLAARDAWQRVDRQLLDLREIERQRAEANAAQ